MTNRLNQMKSFCLSEKFRVLANDFYGEVYLVNGALSTGLASVPQLKILNPKIIPLPVFVMNVFVLGQRASQVILHDLAMHEDVLAVAPDGRVPLPVDKRRPVSRFLSGMSRSKISSAGHAVFVHGAKTFANIEASATGHNTGASGGRPLLSEGSVPRIAAIDKSTVMGIAVSSSSCGPLHASNDGACPKVTDRFNCHVRASGQTELAEMHRAVPGLLGFLLAPIRAAIGSAARAISLVGKNRRERAPTPPAHPRDFPQIQGASCPQSLGVSLAESGRRSWRVRTSINRAFGIAQPTRLLLGGRGHVLGTAVNAILRGFDSVLRHVISFLVSVATVHVNQASVNHLTLSFQAGD